MKDEKASSACDYTTSDFEDMLSIDPGLQPDTFLGDLDIANLIDNDWIFENMSSAGHPGLPFDSLIHQDDASADGLMKNETTSVPFCNETHQRMLAGSSGSSSPESGHFTENSFSDEHSIATDLSPGRSYDLTPIDEVVAENMQNLWTVYPGSGEGETNVQMECSIRAPFSVPLNGVETICGNPQRIMLLQTMQTNAKQMIQVGSESFSKGPQYNNLSPSGSSYSSDSTESYETAEHDERKSDRPSNKQKQVPTSSYKPQFSNINQNLTSKNVPTLKRPRIQQSTSGQMYFAGFSGHQSTYPFERSVQIVTSSEKLNQVTAKPVVSRPNIPLESLMSDVCGAKKSKVVYEPSQGKDDSLEEVTTEGEPSFEESDEREAVTVLKLTDEEVAVYESECLPLPKNGPLSRADEKNLKRVRRKLKNKWSAQESRRKKKEYLETLEEKCNSVSSENSFLKRRVSDLEYDNRTLLGQLTRLQELISSFGSTRLKCTTGHVSSMMTSLAGAHGTSNANPTGGKNSTVLTMFTVLLASMVSILTPSLADFHCYLLSSPTPPFGKASSPPFPFANGGENSIDLQHGGSQSVALRNLRSSAFLLSPFAPTKILLGQQFTYKSFQEEMKSRVLFSPPESSAADINSPVLPRVSENSHRTAGTEKFAMPLIGYDINERNLELWLSDQNDVTSEPFMDFSEDETPFIIASTLENLDYGMYPASMTASMYYPVGGDPSLGQASNQSFLDRVPAKDAGSQAPVCGCGCGLSRKPTISTGGIPMASENVTSTHGLYF